MFKTIRSYRAFACIVAVVSLVAFGTVQVSAIDLGSVLKVGGIGFLVSKFGPEINKAINAATGRKNIDAYDATKVVPIISFGSGGYIGAAQVQGTQKAVDQVKAVGQIEVAFGNRSFRIKALVPVNDINPTKFKRVKGTGVSAVIDVKI